MATAIPLGHSPAYLNQIPAILLLRPNERKGMEFRGETKQPLTTD